MKEKSKAALEIWLRDNGASVVDIITRGAGVTQPIGVRLIQERAGVGVFELDCDGRKAIVKAFDDRSAEARNACEREAYALHKMRDTGLVPQLYSFAPEDAFILTEFVEGASLNDVLNASNLLEMSWKIGHWLACYITHQPVRDLDMDWFTYMAQYKGVVTDKVRASAQEQFGTNQIAAFALAKNDLAPENFIMRDDGTLIGIDFERSRFKPIGWDVIAAAWVLIKRYPGQEHHFVPALISGWTEAKAAQAPDDFEALTLFFARQA